ncbi:MarR family winged helix-turn-helix transcriptional regulator [Frondihabitans cladoniiphilus]|uniref:HTH marR-type domain-containing protein n=1 Tax=Frondihabitans cladoniiphilus TaxID=715785 RepID=A0ABP8WB96_9MICO
MTMLDERQTQDASAVTDLAVLATAYVSLQRQNVRVASMVADALEIGPTDLRSIMYAAWNENLTPKQLAAYLQLTTGATTSLVDRVVSAGLLVREPHPTDRRSQMLSLTPKGRQSVDLVLATYRHAFEAALSPAEVIPAAVLIEAIAASLATAQLAV